ncbi:hypothetical protein ACQYAD_08545 [Neobacillus sp. SM06]|uniref:hypothetical protein n=1 Tax=Neobacillus sp. SM06 TaxID=3422492 RepID=UPI003D2806F1
MLKKMNVLIVLSILLMALPIQAFATSVMAGDYYPPSDSDYYQKKISWKLYFDYDTVKVKIRQYDLQQALLSENEMSVTPNSYLWFDMTCQGTTTFEFFDTNGTSLGFATRGEDSANLLQSTCSPPTLSDYNETSNQYASDTFGGTKTPLSDPPTADGSGGSGTGGTSPGTGTDPINCPGWSEYMSGLNDIKNAIPPAPNWEEVAGTFRDAIVPKAINDLGNLLGSAPDEPATPPQPPGTDDRGINNEIPQMNDVPGLGDSGFDAGKIKNEAPQIPERQDPTGGFDLVKDPVASLPELPGDSLPKPGSTDPGEWGKNKPAEPDNPLPAAPKDPGTPDTTGAPKPAESSDTPPAPGDSTGSVPTPSDTGGTPPMPADNGDTAPSPGDTGGTAPTPGGDVFPGMKDYKPSPDSADGSGGVINP